MSLLFSSPGGSFTAGSGPTLTSITIAPWNTTVDYARTVFPCATITMPQAPYPFYPGLLLADHTLDITIGVITQPLNVYALFFAHSDGQLFGGLQFTSNSEDFQLPFGPVEFHLPTVTGAAGSTQVAVLWTQLDDNRIPEPGSGSLALLGACLMACAFGLRWIRKQWGAR